MSHMSLLGLFLLDFILACNGDGIKLGDGERDHGVSL